MTIDAYSDESDRSFRLIPASGRSEATLMFPQLIGGRFGGAIESSILGN